MSLELETGLRYRFGTTDIQQDVIDDVLVRRYMRYQQDEPFDMTEILRTQFALDDSQYFSTVEVLPGDPDREAADRPASASRRSPTGETVTRWVSATEPIPTSAARLQWEDRRINSAGHRFNVELQAASQQQSLESHYIVPIGDPALEKLAFETTYEKQQLAGHRYRGLQVRAQHHQGDGAVAAGVLHHRRQYDHQVGRSEQHGLPAHRGINLALVPQGYLGEALFSRAFFIQLRGSHHSLGSDSDFLQLDTHRRAHVRLHPQVAPPAARWEVGASIVAEFSRLPGTVRFFAGGDRSVRGFGYNELSPVEVVNERGGGNPCSTRTAIPLR